LALFDTAMSAIPTTTFCWKPAIDSEGDAIAYFFW
jgi:hypothetical protein